MSLFKRCKHKWEVHAKKEYVWNEAHRADPYSITTEVLICTECGKIKIIEY